MNIEYKQKKLGLNLQIEESLIKKIKTITLEHFPNEFGGVLVGHYLEDNFTVIIEDIICPKQYKQSPIFFERGGKYINKELERIYTISEGKTFYIGEWHSHPNMQPFPSLHDSISMKGLLKQDIKITNPLLLIIGGSLLSLKVTCFLLYQNELLRYEES